MKREKNSRVAARRAWTWAGVRGVLAAGAIMCVMLTNVAAMAQAGKPNIVLVLMDNFGWGEVGCYGGGILRGAPTPRIDSLADEGLKFLNFNVESQCVPSRSAFMTGSKGQDG